MVSIRALFIILALVSVIGCTAVKVQPVGAELKIKHVCIEDGKKMCFDGDMMGVILEGFERHGITTQIYTGDLPSECEYHLSYICERTWDMATYMHHAELSLYSNQVQIGFAEYHLKAKGGWSVTKYESTKKKMDPVIDELLSDYPVAKKAP